jgi:omega-hydroxy-beta-dihydromenaquinone-9 sulfotransferase
MNIQPLAGSSISNLLRLLIANGGVDLEYVPKLLAIAGLSFAGLPARIVEAIQFSHAIATCEINHPPIFIIGHWRSGTTYLHNLISQDKNLAYLSTYQAWTPEQSLSYQPISRWVLKQLIPATRPMDNVALSVDAPQEEEYAIANLCPYSYYHAWSFPRKMQQYFTESVLFEGAPDIRANWKQTYLKVLKLATIAGQGRQLVLKNPANTARVKALLELCPNAKFIHIYRNPYLVYLSTEKLYQGVLPIHTFQKYSESKVREHIFRFYEQLMQRFFQDQHLIPKENLIEIRYETFIENPLSQLQAVYTQFDIPNFETLEPQFAQYIRSQSNYQKNQFSIQPETLEEITRRWKFTIDRWQYPIPA